MSFQKLAGGSGEEPLGHSPFLQSFSMRISRPLRFFAVGAIGLTADLALITLLLSKGLHPLLAGFLALVGATVLTWRLRDQAASPRPDWSAFPARNWIVMTNPSFLQSEP